MIKFGALLKDDHVEAAVLHSKFTESEVGEAEFEAKARQLLASENEQKLDESSTYVPYVRFSEIGFVIRQIITI